MIIKTPCISADEPILPITQFRFSEPSEEKKNISDFNVCMVQNALRRFVLSKSRIPVRNRFSPAIFPYVGVYMTQTVFFMGSKLT